MTAVDLDALEAARAAATPGPWAHEHDDYGDEWWFGGEQDGGQEVIAGHIVTAADHAADAALIVAAVNALPDLLAAVRERDALRAAVEGLAEEFLDELAHVIHEQGYCGEVCVCVDDARALLPVVDRIASERAAGELEAAADWGTAAFQFGNPSLLAGSPSLVVDHLRARAAALRAATGEEAT